MDCLCISSLQESIAEYCLQVFWVLSLTLPFADKSVVYDNLKDILTLLYWTECSQTLWSPTELYKLLTITSNGDAFLWRGNWDRSQIFGLQSLICSHIKRFCDLGTYSSMYSGPWAPISSMTELRSDLTKIICWLHSCTSLYFLVVKDCTGTLDLSHLSDCENSTVESHLSSFMMVLDLWLDMTDELC